MFKVAKYLNFMQKTKIDNFKQIQRSKSYQQQNILKSPLLANICPQ